MCCQEPMPSRTVPQAGDVLQSALVAASRDSPVPFQVKSLREESGANSLEATDSLLIPVLCPSYKATLRNSHSSHLRVDRITPFSR